MEVTQDVNIPYLNLYIDSKGSFHNFGSESKKKR